VTARSAYGLLLDRNIKHAELIGSDTLDSAYEEFVNAIERARGPQAASSVGSGKIAGLPHPRRTVGPQRQRPKPKGGGVWSGTIRFAQRGPYKCAIADCGPTSAGKKSTSGSALSFRPPWAARTWGFFLCSSTGERGLIALVTFRRGLRARWPSPAPRQSGQGDPPATPGLSVLAIHAGLSNQRCAHLVSPRRTFRCSMSFVDLDERPW
jgi:hypothetical protein